ncbi:MAG: hypothetical protein NC240_03315 [Clostridium sp.]|nr:hypothetical protein [Clostridium sp.]
MALFDKFKKEKKGEKGLEALYNIPCDYDGYDVVFLQGHTKPEIYGEISLIVSNFKYDIKKLKEYNRLKVDSSLDEFYAFYDIWTDDLKSENFMVHLDNDVSIQEFANKIIEILDKNKYKTDITADMLIKEYQDYLVSINLSDTIKYDVLEANIAAQELRKYNLELIVLFAGVGNTEFAIVQASEIEKLKQLESEIK